MSHHTLWTCDRCATTTANIADIAELEIRCQEQAGARIGKRQRDLCPRCAGDLEAFMCGAVVYDATTAVTPAALRSVLAYLDNVPVGSGNAEWTRVRGLVAAVLEAWGDGEDGASA